MVPGGSTTTMFTRLPCGKRMSNLTLPTLAVRAFRAMTRCEAVWGWATHISRGSPATTCSLQIRKCHRLIHLLVRAGAGTVQVAGHLCSIVEAVLLHTVQESNIAVKTKWHSCAFGLFGIIWYHELFVTSDMTLGHSSLGGQRSQRLIIGFDMLWRAVLNYLLQDFCNMVPAWALRAPGISLSMFWMLQQLPSVQHVAWPLIECLCSQHKNLAWVSEMEDKRHWNKNTRKEQFLEFPATLHCCCNQEVWGYAFPTSLPPVVLENGTQCFTHKTTGPRRHDRWLPHKSRGGVYLRPLAIKTWPWHESNGQNDSSNEHPKAGWCYTEYSQMFGALGFEFWPHTHDKHHDPHSQVDLVHKTS